MARLDETRPFIPVGIAVLTVSDTRTTADDRSGDTLAARIEAAGHRLVARAIVGFGRFYSVPAVGDVQLGQRFDRADL